ncbi:hypothetical protein PR003_g30800, partial [Phytophthora rubi]
MIAWSDPKSALTCLVNPTNPAGDKYGRGADEELHRDHVPDDHTIIVNKIMQPWVGPQWCQDSTINSATHRQRRIAHAPHAAEIKRKQMSWSVTLMTLAFLSAVVKDDAYLQQTSDVTPPRWRASAVQQLSKHFPTRELFGKPF